jgi:uncharacterized protein
MEILTQIITNKVIIACLVAWLTSQIIKTAINVFREKKFDLNDLFFGVGGMPSSHTSVTCCLTTALLVQDGVTTIFAVALILTLITIRDALGVRRESGNHARILNKITKTMYNKKSEEQFNEILGHTPLQVLVGAIIGILTALLLV